MAFSLTRFSWLWLGGKEKEQVSNGSLDCGVGSRGEAECLEFYSAKGVGSSLTRKAKRKWKSREERMRRRDREFDAVVVPSDGVSLSGSESDDSDWSIGWLEQHAPDFQSDDGADGSFAVLVPCYRHDCNAVKEEVPSIPFLNATDYSADGKRYIERWLASLQNF